MKSVVVFREDIQHAVRWVAVHGNRGLVVVPAIGVVESRSRLHRSDQQSFIRILIESCGHPAAQNDPASSRNHVDARGVLGESDRPKHLAGSVVPGENSSSHPERTRTLGVLVVEPENIERTVVGLLDGLRQEAERRRVVTDYLGRICPAISGISVNIERPHRDFPDRLGPGVREPDIPLLVDVHPQGVIGSLADRLGPVDLACRGHARSADVTPGPLRLSLDADASVRRRILSSHEGGQVEGGPFDAIDLNAIPGGHEVEVLASDVENPRHPVRVGRIGCPCGGRNSLVGPGTCRRIREVVTVEGHRVELAGVVLPVVPQRDELVAKLLPDQSSIRRPFRNLSTADRIVLDGDDISVGVDRRSLERKEVGRIPISRLRRLP